MNKHFNPMVQGATVHVVDGKFEQALRKFKNKVQDSGLLLELREREGFTKPTAKRKKAAAQAKKRWQKKVASEQMLPKLF